MNDTPKFPHRVFLNLNSEDAEGVFYCSKNRDSWFTEPYVSIEEHNHLIREAKAEVHEEYATYFNNCDSKWEWQSACSRAKAIREGK